MIRREVLVELAKARQIARGELQNSCRGDQGRFSLQQIGAVDCEQRLAFLHIVPNRGIKGDDPPLVGREHLRRHVLVEIDAPDRFFLDRERTLRDRLDFDCGELRIRQINTIAIALGRRRPIALLGIGRRRTKLGMRGLT